MNGPGFSVNLEGGRKGSIATGRIGTHEMSIKTGCPQGEIRRRFGQACKSVVPFLGRTLCTFLSRVSYMRLYRLILAQDSASL